jgi:DNA replication protein DnaC
MNLKNYQYNRILREYDSKQLQAKWDLNLRTEEIYNEIPELRDIDQTIASGSIKYAKLLLEDNHVALEDLRETNRALSQKKKALLKEHGYPDDYLQPKYSCPDCRDTGYIGSEKCHCFKQAIVNLLYSQSGLKNTLDQENFSSFDLDYYSDEKSDYDDTVSATPYENARRALTECKSFVDNFDNEYKNLLIFGKTGVGKTFLANCIAKGLLDTAHTVIYLTSFQLFDMLEKYTFRKYGGDNSLDEGEAGLDYILDADLLIIDDLGTELTNSFITSRLYLCLNERDLRRKSTVISTNLSLTDLNNNYSERIFSRIMNNYTLVKMIGSDIRFKKHLNSANKKIV